MHTIARSTNAVLYVLALAACAGGSRSVELAAGPAAPAITADELRRDLVAFSADSFGGRATGTAHAAKAARFLTQRLQSLGVEPAGDSGYLQRVPLKRNTMTAAELSVSGASSPRLLSLGMDLLVLSNLGSGALPRLTADAELVFASYGIQDLGRSDFTGLDLAGKTLVMVAGAPPNADSLMRARYGSIQSAFTRLGGLVQRRPAAIIVLVKDSTFALAQGQFSSQQLEVAGDEPAAPANRPRPLPMVAIGRVSHGSPFVPSDWPSNDRARAMPGTRFVARLSEKVDTVITHNVVGIVRGSDAARRNTFGAYGAHYDHVGTRPPTADNPDTVLTALTTMAPGAWGY
ncbi:MAG: hypothetical protein ACT4P6_09845 [Gemmatimonadaceae bacterium]